MPLDDINRCIAEYEKYNFIFSDDFLENIRKDCISWKNDWVESFKRILRRIKKGEEGRPAYDKKDGRRLTVPIVKNKCMVIYFLPNTNNSYCIYSYKLIPRENI
jgi:hypothetical protein